MYWPDMMPGTTASPIRKKHPSSSAQDRSMKGRLAPKGTTTMSPTSRLSGPRPVQPVSVLKKSRLRAFSEYRCSSTSDGEGLMLKPFELASPAFGPDEATTAYATRRALLLVIRKPRIEHSICRTHLQDPVCALWHLDLDREMFQLLRSK